MKLAVPALIGMAFLAVAALPVPEGGGETSVAPTAASSTLMWSWSDTHQMYGFSAWTWPETEQLAADHVEGPYSDWRLPTVEEIQSAEADGSFGQMTPGICTIMWSSEHKGGGGGNGNSKATVVWVCSDSAGNTIPGAAGEAEEVLQRSHLYAKFVRDVGSSSSPPTVTGIAPNFINAGDSIQVVIGGTDFAPGAAVTFVNGSGKTPQASAVTVDNSTTITATVTASNKGPSGTHVWDVRVTNPDGSFGTSSYPDGFTVIK